MGSKAKILQLKTGPVYHGIIAVQLFTPRSVFTHVIDIYQASVEMHVHSLSRHFKSLVINRFN